MIPRRFIVCFIATLFAGLIAQSAHAQKKNSEPLETQLLSESPESLAKAARKNGDPIRGAILFYQQNLSCTKCHSNGATPSESPLGPDLSHSEPGTMPERLVEALLVPSKLIRKGYEAVTINRADGTTVTGLIAETRNDAIVLRDATAPLKLLTIANGDIESRKNSANSLMPVGLMNMLADRQQFLDLVSYLVESAEFGPARARSLRPDPSIIDPPLPAYEADLDHAGLVTNLNNASLKRGEAIYTLICASCHGTKDTVGSMPTALRFAEGKLKNGADLHSMYKTVTRGYGMMAAQQTLVPQQKYDVIHYIREQFFKPHNSTQYLRADANYLAALPKGISHGPAPSESAPWKKMDYGQTLMGTFEVSPKNIAYKGIAVRLDDGPGGIAQGKAFVIYEHDTLRMAAGWTGEGFCDWNGINFNGRHQVHPKIVGSLAFENLGLGWANPETGLFTDPRELGRDGKPYGPLPKSWAKYRSLTHVGNRAILTYTVGQTLIQESPGVIGSAADAVFTRSFEIGARAAPLILRMADDTPTIQSGVVALTGGELTTTAGQRLLRIPAGNDTIRFNVWVGREAPTANIGESLDIAALIKSKQPTTPQTLTTQLNTGTDNGPFAVDTFTAPDKNPWSAQLRFTGLDFHDGGKELVACTWDGDVWKMTGLERADGNLSWTRIATGLFQPLGLKIVNGLVHVGCRDQIVRLRDTNNDGLTDTYECLNSDHLVTESFHEFAMGLQTDADGNFYYTKSARHGQTAVVPHHGTLLRVAKDGSKTDILATGFRAPNGVCVNPDGTFFVTDQEGHWVPKNRINWIRPGSHFYGNLWGYTTITDPSDTVQDEPLCWITNRFDRSPAELLWVKSPQWGGLNGALLNLSYGTGKVYVVPHETIGEQMQGGVATLPLPPFATGIMRGRFNPLDGQLYACGMYAWAGNQQQPGGLYRIRATGQPSYLPVGYHVTREGLALTFSEPLRPDSVSDPKNFGLKIWDLTRSARYGSAHQNEQALTVTMATLSPDGKTITLTIPKLRATRGLELWYSVRGANGRAIDGLLHATINKVPE